jgi:hypothetical protein
MNSNKEITETIIKKQSQLNKQIETKKSRNKCQIQSNSALNSNQNEMRISEKNYTFKT